MVIDKKEKTNKRQCNAVLSQAQEFSYITTEYGKQISCRGQGKISSDKAKELTR